MMNSEQGGGAASIQRSFRMQDMPAQGTVMRERSFVRPQSHHQNFNHPHQLRDGGKRKSMIVTTNNRVKPTMEIYRPPSVRVDGVQQQQNKLNVHAKEFTMSKHNDLQTSRSNLNINQMYTSAGLNHSKSSGSILQQLMAQQSQGQQQQQQQQHQQQQHPQQQMGGRGLPAMLQPPPLYPHHHAVLPLLTSASSSNLLHGPPRVHFKLQPQQMNTIPLTPLVHDRKKSPPMNGQAPSSVSASNGVPLRRQPQAQPLALGLKRSKSLTASDTLASGMAALGLTADASDLGIFPQEIQDNLDKATKEPNQLPARVLMELVGHVLRRAVESPRYALPAARACLAIIERERTQTFLESLLNTCQQWYQDRDKLLNVMIGGGRPRLMAFISLLLELFCQLRRRCPSSPSPNGVGGPAPTGGISAPARALLTLICRCCEECIRAPVPSASDTENLFFVLTYIGRDLETQLPGDLEKLLSAVRDAFLNASAAAPSVSRTLLQLIELHASHWQLPGGAVLYYYPSTK